MGTDVLVGRERELAVLDAFASTASTGSPVVALVAGEAGIGKSSILDAYSARASAGGQRVLRGRATAMPGAPAFWPWRQVLGDLIDTADDDPARIRPEHRFAAFTAIATRLGEETADRPTAILLDDLHWADTGSLTLLTHLVHELRAGQVMIVGAARPAELRGRQAGEDLIAAVARRRSGALIELDGLAESAVARQLTALLGYPPEPAVAAAVRTRSGGNPLFVRELGRMVREGAATTAPAPVAVRDAVRQHLGVLSAPARDLLAASALAGMDIDPALAAAVLQLDVAAALELLDEACRAGVLRTQGAGYRFVHDVFRECLELDLPVSRAAQLHLRIADQLDGTAEIAHHRLAALPLGDPVAAAAAARQAGRYAVAQFAFEDAAAIFDRGLTATLAPATRIPLLLDAGRAHYLSHDIEAAMERCAETVRLATAVGATEGIADAALMMPDVSEPAWGLQIERWCTEALDRLPPGDTPLRARLIARRSLAGAFTTDAAAMATASAEALAMAERVEDDDALLTALRARQIARSLPEGNAERVGLGSRMIELGTRIGNDDAVSWGRIWRFEAFVQAGRTVDAEAELTALGAAVDRLRQPLHRWHLLRARTVVHVGRGRFAAARHTAQQSLRHIAGNRFAESMTAIGPLLEVAMLTGDTAYDPFPRLPRGVDEPSGVQPFGGRIAEWHVTFGRTDAARVLHHQLAGAHHHLPPFLVLLATASAAAVSAALGDVDGARAAYQRLLPHQHLHAASGAGIGNTGGSVHHYLGLAAAAIGRPAQAIEHFAASAGANDAAGLAPYACRSRLHLAEQLAARNQPGDRDRALDALTACTRTAEQLGMTLVAAAAGALTESLHSTDDQPLSPRQHEVAGLVASGLTNREIAGALHISVRTAENHIQHIMTALGFRTRSQIASWVATRAKG